MNENELEQWINQLIQEDKLYKFYKSPIFVALKNEVINEQRKECQLCLLKIDPKERIRRATTVHHIQFVRKHPRLALSKYYTYDGKRYRNLIAVCKSCHNKLHPEKHMMYSSNHKFKNEERW